MPGVQNVETAVGKYQTPAFAPQGGESVGQLEERENGRVLQFAAQGFASLIFIPLRKVCHNKKSAPGQEALFFCRSAGPVAFRPERKFIRTR
jgi:hypothetical protein